MVKTQRVAMAFFLPSPAFAAVSTGQNVLTTFVALLLVIVVIFLLAKLLKRMQSSSMGSKSKLNIIGQLALGPKERIVVIDINGEQIVVGVTSSQITLLKSLENPFTDTQEVPSFRSQLNRIVRKNDAP